MNFEEVLPWLRRGGRAARPAWKTEYMHIALHHPDDTSIITHPYIYIFSGTTGERVPWAPSQMDILSDDWMRLEG